MKKMVEIDVIIDEDYADPKVLIFSKEKNEQVENIIYSIENASDNDFPAIPAHIEGERLVILSQREIIRVFSEKRKVFVQTEDNVYYVKKNMSAMEELLNSKRFIRISQSEIINLYKVKHFDINIAGTIGIEFDDGTKSWASRSRVKAIKDMLM